MQEVSEGSKSNRSIKQIITMPYFTRATENLIGQRFGRLLITDNLGVKGGRTTVIVRCDCGTVKETKYNYLIQGAESCGCLGREKTVETKTKHSLCKHKLYNVWATMKTRCFNDKHPSYIHWGGRGITVCDAWKNNFQTFYNWALESGYAPGLQIDRINNDGNYEPENCRWATPKENSNNRRTAKITNHADVR